MPDLNNHTGNAFSRKENVCIDSYRILDSCKDKDCFEDTRLLLTDMGREVLERSGSIRVTETKVVWVDINTEPVKFNRGFYQVNIRLFTKVTCEACVGAGKIQQIEGIAVNDKKVVLYGGESNVSIFRCTDSDDNFCTNNCETVTKSSPNIVLEVVDPIALSIKVSDHCHDYCPCCPDELPGSVLGSFNGSFSDFGNGGRSILVSLGFFSIVRIERPAQFIMSASEYSVPDKVCCKPEEDDPCKLFAKMSFPVNEFSSNPNMNGSGNYGTNNGGAGGCGCGN